MHPQMRNDPDSPDRSGPDDAQGRRTRSPKGGGGSSRGRNKARGDGRRGGRGRHRHKVSRGDVRLAILALLADEPMHGYQVMQELSERSGGAWRPSPGSIYPTLQQLADEGLIEADKDGDRKVFSLTEAGREANESSDSPPPWEDIARDESHVDMRGAISSVVDAAKQIGQVGSPDQEAAAAEILTDARKRLYQILAD
jgi:DNA-binding PadR family transcriptional regulator